MSGPKTTSYTVSANELVTQRAIAEAWTRIREMETRIEAIATDVKAAKTKYAGENLAVEIHVPAQPPNGSSLAALESHLARLRGVCHQAQSDLNAAVGQIKTRKMLALLGKEMSSDPETAAEVLKRAMTARAERSAATAAQQAAMEKKQRADTVARSMGRLCADVDGTARAGLDRLCGEIMQSDSAQRSQVLQSELRFQVQSINDQSKALRLEADEASKLIVQLRGLESPDVRSLVAELGRVERRESRMTDSLRRRTDHAYQAAKAAADRQYAATVTAQVLSDLGYEVEGGLATLFVAGGTVHFHKPDWDDYWVRLRVDPARDQINFNVVRAVDGEDKPTREAEVRDKEMEEKWCTQFQQVLDALHQRGVASNVLRRERPGEFPVQVVRDGKLAAKRRRGHVSVARTAQRNAPH
jgi:hypothetical protein